MFATLPRPHLLFAPSVLLCALALPASSQAAPGAAHRDEPKLSDAAKEVKKPVLRLSVADESGKVSVFHAASGRELMSATMPSPVSSLVALGDGRHLAAVMGAGNLVQIIDSGSWTEPHGDHGHSFLATPKAAGAPLAASKPSHVVGVGDDVVIFSDGSGRADRYSLAALAASAAPASGVSASFAHHGVAVPFGTGMLISSAPAAAGRPDSVTQVRADGQTVGRFGGCPVLHGETSGDDWAAFGCADGTLLLEGTPLAVRKLAYPERSGAARVGTWNRSGSGRHLIGALGTAGILILDRRSGSQHITMLDGLVHAVTVDHASGAALALTRDGKLHRVAIATGAVIESTQAIAPFTAVSGAPAPRLTAAGGRVAVTEPAANRVLVLATKGLRSVAATRTTAKPVQVALTGAAPTH